MRDRSNRNRINANSFSDAGHYSCYRGPDLVDGYRLEAKHNTA